MAPKPRNDYNLGLPYRWRKNHGAYYYRVPEGDEHRWAGRKDYWLGKTFDQALQEYERVVTNNKSLEKELGEFPDEIEIAAKKVDIGEDRTGVYFLLRENRVVYVGQTRNVLSRLASHKDKNWDGLFFLPAPLLYLTLIEAYYIHLLDPEYNELANGDGRLT